jgi:ABC-type nickel/cobalt efflux system permease component RcnA
MDMWNKITSIFLFLFVFIISVNAHPLGNFSVNNFSRIEIEKDQINLHCFLDMAEVPTFQESQQIDTNNDKKLSDAELNAYLEKITPQYIANLKLFLDDKPLNIQTESKEISIPLGSGNLPILKIDWKFTAKIPENTTDAIHRLRFENTNFNERVGWNEIVINRTPGINVFDSNAFGSALSDELKTYPEDMLTAPLTEREAELSFTTADIPANTKALQNRNGTVSSPVQKDRLAELISETEVTPFIIFMGLLLAFGLGAMHAMSPGHGKTVVGAYLVGSKGTIKHAMFLGLTVTITHTLGVFALGLITLFASQFILPERIMPFLSFISGLLVLFIGLNLFKDRLFSALGYKSKHQHHHDHNHFDGHGEAAGFHHEHHEHHEHDEHGEHQHDDFVHTHDGHTHSHQPPENITWKSLLALGISGGLLPCPSALVLMLSAISLNRIGYGFVLTIAFSIGLAATLMCVGLAFLYLGKLLDRPSLGQNPVIKALPVFSAFVISCLGAVICYNSFAM